MNRMSPTKDISQLNDLLMGTNYSIVIIIGDGKSRTQSTSRHTETHQMAKVNENRWSSYKTSAARPDNNGIKRSALWRIYSRWSGPQWKITKNSSNSTGTSITNIGIAQHRKTYNTNDNNTYDTTLLGNFYLLERFLWLLMFDFSCAELCCVHGTASDIRYARSLYGSVFYSFYHFVFIIDLTKWFNFVSIAIFGNVNSRKSSTVCASCHRFNRSWHFFGAIVDGQAFDGSLCYCCSLCVDFTNKSFSFGIRNRAHTCRNIMCYRDSVTFEILTCVEMLYNLKTA